MKYLALIFSLALASAAHADPCSVSVSPRGPDGQFFKFPDKAPAIGAPRATGTGPSIGVDSTKEPWSHLTFTFTGDCTGVALKEPSAQK